MIIEIEVFQENQWKRIGCWDVTIGEENRGFSGKGVWRYDMLYALEHLHSLDKAVSLSLPITLDSIAITHWPAFLLDMLPGGPARDQWLELLKISNGPGADAPLLVHAGRAPVGTLRVKHETWVGKARGFERSEIIDQQHHFLLYMRDTFTQQLHLPQDTPYSAADSQGAAPKYLLTQDHSGLWWAEGTLPDSKCAKFWLVKFPRGQKTRKDILVLQGEARLHAVAKACGALVSEAPILEGDVLFIPRFDREVTASHKVRRLGLETLCSVLGVAEFGHRFFHEDLCTGIAQFSSDPQADLLEYVRRDILNIALANSDNHARNTSLIKVGGAIRISPIYDFAPMELDPEGIARAITWKNERLYAPDWIRIATFLSTWVPRKVTCKLYAEMATHIAKLERTMKNAQVPKEIMQHCKPRWPTLLQSLQEASREQA